MEKQIILEFCKLEKHQYGYLHRLGEMSFVDIAKVDRVIGEIASDRVNFAKELFEEARHCDLRATVSRRKVIFLCYYSQYHLARALVYYVHRYDNDSHKDLPFEVTKLLGEQFGRMLKNWREMRNIVDYEPYVYFDLKREAQKALSETEGFFAVCAEYLGERGITI